ncbi:MAG: LptF/LptG family permease [Candidatus Obscuribacterales bacterium]|nr:LptF/LptG family permease [Candidatus Obscuribacterales bacterium]
MTFGVKMLDRYIANEFWQPLLFGIGIVTGVWFGAEQLRTIFNLIMKSGVPITMAFEILGLHMPAVIVMTIPIGVLLGTLLVFNRLSGDSEIIALRTSGVSFYRIMVAPLLFGLITSAASFFISELVVPAANQTSKKLEFLALYKSELPKGQANFTYMERGKDLNLDRVFYVGYSNGKEIYNVIVLDFTRDKLVQIIAASSGLWNNGEWLLNKGRTYVLGGTSDITRIMRFDQLTLPGVQNVQKAMDTGKVAPKDMNLWELGRYIDMLKQSNAVSNDILVHYYQKFSNPLACLIVALAGAPLGLLARRSRNNIGFIYSAAIVFIYYVLQSTSGAMGEAGRIDPLLAAWLPNIVIGTLGAVILYFKAK